jgi:WD40 repeat protein
VFSPHKLAKNSATQPLQPPPPSASPTHKHSTRRSTNQLLQHYRAHTGPVTNAVFHPSGHFLLTTSLDASLKLWDLREGCLLYTLQGHEGATLGAAFSPAGDYFASAGADEQVCVRLHVCAYGNSRMHRCTAHTPG